MDTVTTPLSSMPASGPAQAHGPASRATRDLVPHPRRTARLWRVLPPTPSRARNNVELFSAADAGCASTATAGALTTVLLAHREPVRGPAASKRVWRAAAEAFHAGARQLAGAAILAAAASPASSSRLERIRGGLRAQDQPVEQHLPHVLPVADLLPLHARDPGPGRSWIAMWNGARQAARPGDMNGWRPAPPLAHGRLADLSRLFTSSTEEPASAHMHGKRPRLHPSSPP